MNFQDERTALKWFVAEGFEISDVQCEECGATATMAHFPIDQEKERLQCCVCLNPSAKIVAPVAVNSNGERI